MPTFILTLDVSVGTKESVTQVVVEADDATDARNVAAGLFDSDVDWNDSNLVTATQAAAASDYTGWSMRIKLSPPNARPIVDVTVNADPADDFDTFAGRAPAVLNATDPIDNALYTPGSNLLRVAQGSGNDDLGDHALEVELLPPNAVSGVDSYIGAVTDEGVATADVDVTFVEPTDIPTLLAQGFGT